MVKFGTKSRSEVAREVLEELGFLQDDVPKNWKSQTELVLKKRNALVHETILYKIRRDILRSRERKRLEALKAAKVSAVPPVQTAQPTAQSTAQSTVQPNSSLTLDDATKIKTFATQYGGFDKAVEALRAVQNLLA